MLHPALAALALLTFLLPWSGGEAEPRAQSLEGVQLAQVRIQQYIMIRVARARVSPSRAPGPPPPAEWRERKADKCVHMSELTPVAFPNDDSIDLMLVNGKRLRARLDERCGALDFYAGLYIKPQKDGKICADRDSIRSRSGGACQIKAFRSLVPAE